jgi:hypothetical protein
MGLTGSMARILINRDLHFQNEAIENRRPAQRNQTVLGGCCGGTGTWSKSPNKPQQIMKPAQADSPTFTPNT